MIESRRLSLALSLCLVAVGGACDFEELPNEPVSADPALQKLPPPAGEEPAKGGTPAMDQADAHKLPGPDAAFPNDASKRAACLEACAKPGSSPDDQATCRLACGHEPSSTEIALRRHDDCRAACGDGADASCRGACLTTLVSEAGGDDELPAPCAATCMEKREGCATGCKSSKTPDERATCSLHCDSGTERCLQACAPAK